MNKEIISIVIPGYNEEAIIAHSIISVEKELSSLQRPFELLIVNDGSKDATMDIVKNLIKNGNHPYLRFISYKYGPSRRENLTKSFNLLKGKYVLLLDMDLAMDLVHLKDMIYWLEHGYDMVIANRYHSESRIKRNPWRFIVSKLYNRFIQILFRTGFKDNICGFKAFKRNVILQLIKDAGIDKTKKRGVFWDTEIIIHALQRGMKIKEIPVHWEEGKNSALTFRREIKMLPYIIKFWMHFPRKKARL